MRYSHMVTVLCSGGLYEQLSFETLAKTPTIYEWNSFADKAIVPKLGNRWTVVSFVTLRITPPPTH